MKDDLIERAKAVAGHMVREAEDCQKCEGDELCLYNKAAAIIGELIAQGDR